MANAQEQSAPPLVAADILEAAPDAMIVVNEAGEITRVNAAAEAMFGYQRQELEGQPIETLLPERTRAGHVGLRTDYTRAPQARPMGVCMDLAARRRDGSEFQVEISLSPVRTADGLRIISAIRDVSIRRRVQALREERDFIAAVLKTAGALVVVLDPEGRVERFNRACERISGYRAEELIGSQLWRLIPEEERASVQGVFAALLEGSGGDFYENHWLSREGERRLIAWSNTVLRDVAGAVQHVIATGIDISETRRAERALEAARAELEERVSDRTAELARTVEELRREVAERRAAEVERDRLLESERRKSEQLTLAVREAHHRIKNNLQAISDLLYLELTAGEGGNPEAALRESMDRIQAIALVHDLLTHEEDVETVNAAAVAERLVPAVLKGNSITAGDAEVEIRVPTLALSSKKATTLALILNELVTNAAKHALAKTTAPRLEVVLEQADGGLRMVVQDNGPGLPAEFDLRTDSHVGLEVVRILAERDLAGQFEIRCDHGLRAEVWFPW